MSNQRLNLKAGDWVEVRSKDAILATLDENGRLDRLPFMPEMFAFCGRRFKVSARAHKTCDTVNQTGGRRMTSTVHLEDLRCDGAAHGGCQAECLIFWKEAWLDRVNGPAAMPTPTENFDGAGDSGERGEDETRVWAATRSGAETSDVTYVCQATTLPEFTTLLPWWDIRQYAEDYTSGNVTFWQLLQGGWYVGLHAFVNRVGRYAPRLARQMVRAYDWFQAATGGVPYPRKWGKVPRGEKTPSQSLDLKAGDLIQVKTYDEILATLDASNKNRGMYFDAEEVPYCGKTVRVRSEVSRIIDERTGKMLVFKDRSVILEGVVCRGHYSDRRMFCPRAIYPYWREAWLTRSESGFGVENASEATRRHS